MKAVWKIWPKSRIGWWALGFAVAFAFAFTVISLWVEAMSHQPDTSVTVVNLWLVPATFALVSIILGWIALIQRKDRSVILLVVTIAMSLQALIVAIFEILEILL